MMYANSHFFTCVWRGGGAVCLLMGIKRDCAFFVIDNNIFAIWRCCFAIW